MTDQLFAYFLCYLLGWVPLYYIYRKIEQFFPFKADPGKVQFSLFPFFKLVYFSAEILRAVFVMEVVHQWLESDWDLFVGIALFMVAIFWPIGFSVKFRTSSWIPLIGIYGYLLPYFSWFIPFLVLFFSIIDINLFFRYIFIGALFLLIGVLFTDINNLYIGFYFFIIFMMVLNVYFSNVFINSSDRNSSSISS